MKGLSPVVSIVLLISLSVVTAVGVYWWSGGLTGQQRVPSKPATIAVEVVGQCASSGNTTVIITNTSPPGKEVAAGSLTTTWSGGLAANSTAATGTCPTNKLLSGEQESCVMVNFVAGSGTEEVYATGVAAAPVAC